MIDSTNQIPESIKLPVDMLTPNADIEIHNGSFRLVHGESSYEVNGLIYFAWLPNIRVRFNCIVNSMNAVDFNLELGENIGYDVVIDNLKFGTAYLTNRSFGGQNKLQGYINSGVKGDRAIGVSEVTFGIPNVKEFYGSAIKSTSENEIKTDSGRLTFKSKDYTIIIDKLSDYKNRHELLKNRGGHILLYAGKITKNKGEIKLKDLQEFLLALDHFLYFLTGRRTSPLFLTGKHDGQILWQDFSCYKVDSYRYVPSWSDIMHVNFLQELWSGFEKLWQDDDDRDFLTTAIHWYIEANSNAAYVEGSIILAQTALELIYNWLVIERNRIIIGDDAENLSASNKIRLILTQLSISPEIPLIFNELLLIKDVIDGPEVFVQIRNALVHGQEKKRRKLMNMSSGAKFQAVTLAIWYIELSLLKILGYHGKYKNRVSGDTWFGEGDKLPWQ